MPIETGISICPDSFQQEKLKEKKPTMTEALSQSLQAMHKSGCFTLIDVIEGL